MSTMSAAADLGYGLEENEGEAIWLLGMLQTIKIGRDDTAGEYGLVEVVVPESVGPPWHVHAEEDDVVLRPRGRLHRLGR